MTMKTSASTRFKVRSVRGFSLVELMVAIAVGLILVTGLALLFANSSQSGNELDKSIRQIENGRYALELLTEDVSVAGYYGEVPSSGLSLISVGACETTAANLGWSNAAFTAPVPVTGLSPTEAAALACLSNHKVGTSALVLRRLDTTAIAPSAAASGTLYLQTSRCVTDPTATRFVASTSAADFNLKGLDCTAVNAAQRYITRIYYIASCNECGFDTVPTLKRAELRGSQIVTSPLAEGIESMAFDFGFDTNNDGGPDVYRVALSGVVGDADNTWANVTGLRIHLLSRTTESSPGFVDSKVYDLGLTGSLGPFNDSFKRRVYTATTRLNNIAGPREIP